MIREFIGRMRRRADRRRERCPSISRREWEMFLLNQLYRERRPYIYGEEHTDDQKTGPYYPRRMSRGELRRLGD
jgi:hypothetical protein